MHRLIPGQRTAPKHWRQAEPLYLTGCISIGPVGDPIRSAGRTQRRLGVLAQPGNTVHTQAPHFGNWAVDNGAFGVARQAYFSKRGPWTDDDTEDYLRYLARVRDQVDISSCLFATAPDVLTFIDNPDPIKAAAKKDPIPVGDAAATWERSRHIFDAIRQLGFPAALVAQDGITQEHPTGQRHWDLFDVLFLGGSDLFKLGPEGEQITSSAWHYGKWVHMGRVSSMRRMLHLQRIGCDSADGTYLGFGPDKNLPNVLRWLDATARPSTPVALPAAA